MPWGGVPKTAMNLVAFPSKSMDLGILRQIIQGGIDKLREAEVVLVGGHSVEDSEIKYGLSVTGIVHPAKVLARSSLRVGDRLVLTKSLGTGHRQYGNQGCHGVRGTRRTGSPAKWQS